MVPVDTNIQFVWQSKWQYSQVSLYWVLPILFWSVWFPWTQTFSLYGRANVNVHRFFCTVRRQYCSVYMVPVDTDVQFVWQSKRQYSQVSLWAFSLNDRENFNVHRFFCTVRRQYCSVYIVPGDTSIQFVWQI